MGRKGKAWGELGEVRSRAGELDEN